MELEAKLEKPAIVTGTRQINNLLIKMKTPPAVHLPQRQPLVIGLAIDKSWSMKGDKMEATIEAACSLVNWLTRHDYVTIIAYSADVQVVQPLIQLKEKSAVLDKIRSIQVATSTNLSGGWLQTLRAVESAGVPNAYKRVILLTDGQATLGIKDPLQFNQIAADHIGRGVSTTTIGFGEDFNETSLRDIAVNGGGNFYYVSSPEQTSEIFFREFGDIGALYAQAVEVKLKLAPNVKMLEIYNDFPFQSNEDGTISIQSGDVRADDARSIVMSLEIDAEKNIDAPDLLNIDVSYYNLFEKMRLDKISRSLPLVKTAKEPDSDSEVVVERLVTSSAKTVIKAAKLIKENDVGMARTLLQAAMDRVEDNIKLSPDILNPILQRLKNIEIKLRENAASASKHFMAEGSDLYSRMDIIDTGGVDVHDRIFEYKVIGDIDLYKCPDIKATVQSQMRDGYRFVIFDLSDCKFIDSSAIGAFIQIVGWLRKRGGEFIVTNIVDSVRKVFTITRLENHIRVATSMDEARDIVESIISATSR
ncbi:MAG TPA: anti-sigma factor antagonist [Leptospiraceae bacterium]|nr:anti-sigma factor antagonist [Leptospiraceae bacterium]HMW06416.1 anti-sigma factor antagonist [Leptospiraceae bacterium]HMX31672.1 anti-sigma factor antagonist [Leptospiraceae bacterium]HMY31958.1 anti-sigma factor antagonist [Leptospiraceae bacterium]HMZ63178.1 anti-sigma factor antagonist [Leptospiraceae bacterium]